jgi:hypothetical protein
MNRSEYVDRIQQTLFPLDVQKYVLDCHLTIRLDRHMLQYHKVDGFHVSGSVELIGGLSNP